MHVSIYIYIHIHTYIHTCTYIYIYIIPPACPHIEHLPSLGPPIG